jgi:predicted ester cyclase
MEEPARNPELAAFDPLVGDWTIEATHPMFPSTVVTGHMSYEWLEGEQFLVQRSSNDHPDFPDSISVIGFADKDEELTAYYFDSRGVFRTYRVAMERDTLRMWRDAPGFSQRLEAKLSDDGATLAGVWQLSRDDETWTDDLAIAFTRAVAARPVAHVRAFWERVFNGRDLGLLDEITAPDFVNRNALPGTPSGPEGQRQVVERLWEAFPDAHFDIEQLTGEGDTVICVGTMSGTHEGTLLGVPGTGRKVAWRQCHLYRVDEHGRAVEHDAIRDDVGLLRQFGEAD